MRRRRYEVTEMYALIDISNSERCQIPALSQAPVAHVLLREKRSAPRPCSIAKLASMPASMHFPAATVTDRGASRTGQPVGGSRMWP